jgi:hypothetical protein
MKWGIVRKMAIAVVFAAMVLSMAMLYIHDQKWALLFMALLILWNVVWREI